VSDIAHDRVYAPVLNERLQLALKICRLLPCKSRHWKRASKTLTIYTMAGLAIGRLVFKFFLKNRGWLAFFGAAAPCAKKNS
jgi:hypothetical protein